MRGEGTGLKREGGQSPGRVFWVAGCLLGFLAVAAGAFGAHALEGRVEPRLLDVYETAVHYHLAHALALLAAAFAADHGRGRAAMIAGWSFLLGVVIFSGSLYLLTFTGVGWFGAVTPVGGTALLVGWLALAASALQR